MADMAQMLVPICSFAFQKVNEKLRDNYEKADLSDFYLTGV
jgi:hypothetical protein